MSAFACEPGQDSEPEVGWQWALQMARFHDVTILTQSKNRPAIERASAEMSERQPVPRFIYFERRWLLPLRRWVAGLRIYCVFWQKAARGLVANLHRTQPFDLMHHVTFAAFRYPTAIWGHGVPTVWGPIGGIEDSPMQLLPWQNPAALLPELARNLHNGIQRWPFGSLARRLRATTLTLASTPEMQRLFERMGHKVPLMPTIGLHVAAIPFRPRPATEEPLKLLFVGKLIALKGIHLALEAMAISGTNAELTVIGTGPFQEGLRRLAERFGLSARVSFRGRRPRQEVLQSYADFDVLLFPSFHDTGGYAVIEAMANGLPVICLERGGPAIAVQEGAGIKVPVGSRKAVIDGLATAIQTYHRDRRLRLEHGRQARQRIIEFYDWDKKGAQLAAIYEQAAAK